MSDSTPRPILLSGRDAIRCARRIHNDRAPMSGEPIEWSPPPELQMRFDAGREFEADVFAALKAALPAGSWVDLSSVFGKGPAIAATVGAMTAQVAVILGGWLPDDVAGSRTGRPDILMLADDGGYVPGDVKGHQMVGTRKTGTLTYSTFADPARTATMTGHSVEKSLRFGDHVQLAHYWRMLEAMGSAAGGTPRGFIIGTDVLPVPGGRALTWVDLDSPDFETYSRSEGKKKRSALERYDHELGFRVKVAANAAAGEPALVRPIFTDECSTCPWLDHCQTIADPDEPSAAITSGRLSIREWTALAGLGVTTVQALAELDPTDPDFLADYEPEVTHLNGSGRRLATAVRRARMVRDCRAIERETDGPIDMPRADVEIDFDIEWDIAERVYLWGVLITRDGGQPEYRAFVRWSVMSAAEARELAEEFAAWLREEMAAADARGRSLRVYHYSPAERSRLVSVLGAECADLLERFDDLHVTVRKNFFGLHGLSVKQVAPAFGFHWRDDNPGGLQSQAWLEAARTADTGDAAQARQRLLDYNEDDVRATAAIRAGIRQGLLG